MVKPAISLFAVTLPGGSHCDLRSKYVRRLIYQALPCVPGLFLLTCGPGRHGNSEIAVVRILVLDQPRLSQRFLEVAGVQLKT